VTFFWSQVNKKILLAQKAKFNYMLVVGAEEEKINSAAIRTRSNEKLGVKTIDEIIALFNQHLINHE